MKFFAFIVIMLSRLLSCEADTKVSFYEDEKIQKIIQKWGEVIKPSDLKKNKKRDMEELLKAFKIDPLRIQLYRTNAAMKVTNMTWKVSENYVMLVVFGIRGGKVDSPMNTIPSYIKFINIKGKKSESYYRKKIGVEN